MREKKMTHGSFTTDQQQKRSRALYKSMAGIKNTAEQSRHGPSLATGIPS